MKAKPCCKHEKMWEELKIKIDESSVLDKRDKHIFLATLKIIEEKHADTD
jgi:hypothetical protein